MSCFNSEYSLSTDRVVLSEKGEVFACVSAIAMNSNKLTEYAIKTRVNARIEHS